MLLQYANWLAGGVGKDWVQDFLVLNFRLLHTLRYVQLFFALNRQAQN